MTRKWTTQDIGGLEGRTALITGASSGLGLHASHALAGAGARVLMACRNPGKGAGARDAVQAGAPDATVELAALDLADLSSVAGCAKTLADAGTRLDLLINNAGVMAVPYGQTADGFEMQIGTNHFGHFALTAQLAPVLADDARIVTVSSMAHRWTPGIDFDDINWSSRRYKRWQAYGDSKLANLLFHFELTRRARAAGRGWTVAAAHPGYAATHLQLVAAEQKKASFEKRIMELGNRIFAQPAEMGALPEIYAATQADVQSGDYIGPDGFQQMRGHPTKVGCRRAARDEGAAATLWQLSEQLTGTEFALD
ncbi:oxidoreductase [Algiphilus sp.]|uniref:oxidoreductase n=1 Tax=Algiphilus sp. TaxID=1872431 RepID=UPI003C5DB7EA